jgi:SMI1 / KNR4 family (SUKH-1)
MYLAKFFHRPPGDDDRELLLIPGGDPMLIGIRMRERGDEFLREEFSGIGDAVAAFRRQAGELLTAGYVETTHTQHTLRNLLPDPQPKSQWQKDLDDLMLAALSAPLHEQARHLKALEDTPAAREPLFLWLAAHQGVAAGDNDGRTFQLAEAARDALAARKAGKMPHYAWSIAERDLEARILDVLSDACLRVDDPIAALIAIERACKTAPSQDRGAQRATILCDHFPDRQDEAFDAAYRYAGNGGYEAITARPAYAKYVARREGKPKTDKGWRWRAKQPASEADLRKAEQQLGAALPQDYRDFLARFGQTQLEVKLPMLSGELCFHGPADLARQRKYLLDFIMRTEKEPAKVAGYFRRQYGVSLCDLVPVAEPAQESRCVVIHLEQGDHFGWCFQWDHDGACELEHATPSFDAALKALTDGIEHRDKAALGFLGIYPD